VQNGCNWVQAVRIVSPTKEEQRLDRTGLKTSEALLGAILMATRRACKWPDGLLRLDHELVYFGGSRGDVFAPRKIFRLPAVRPV
jgi:hypothetical protein